jgi:hypothetical protein
MPGPRAGRPSGEMGRQAAGFRGPGKTRPPSCRRTQRGTAGRVILDTIVSRSDQGRAGQRAAHGGAERPAAGPHQAMQVVGQQRPRVHLPGFPVRQRGEPRHEVGPVPAVAEDGPALDAPHHDMVLEARGIQTLAARHARKLPADAAGVKKELLRLPRPLLKGIPGTLSWRPGPRRGASPQTAHSPRPAHQTPSAPGPGAGPPGPTGRSDLPPLCAAPLVALGVSAPGWRPGRREDLPGSVRFPSLRGDA